MLDPRTSKRSCACILLVFFLKNSCVSYAAHVEAPATPRFDDMSSSWRVFAFIVSRDAIFFAGTSEGVEMIAARTDFWPANE